MELDHAIVSARDPQRSARCLAETLGVDWAPGGAGPFSPVYVSDGLTLDFIADASDFPVQHFCFRVTEDEFDAIFARIRERGFAFKSRPHGEPDMKVNTDMGGRIVYWNEPDGHQWEILTRSYARKPSPSV